LRGLEELSGEIAARVQDCPREHADDKKCLLAQAGEDNEGPVMEEEFVGEDVVERVGYSTEDRAVRPCERGVISDARAAGRRREAALNPPVARGTTWAP